MNEKQVFSTELERLNAEALINLLQPAGDVLEIGFGKGYFASSIQTYHPKSHIIIESDAQGAERAKKWSKKHPHVSIMQGTWKTLLPQLGMFNAIVIDASQFYTGQTLSTNDVIHARALIQKEKELYQFVEEKIPELWNIRYSDQDLEEFLQNMTPDQMKDASYFMSELKQRGQITEVQYENLIKKYQLTKEIAKNVNFKTKEPNPLFAFLIECFKNHMLKGTRLACFLNGGISNYEDPQFFEHIITNPNLDYQEHSISIQNHDSLAMLIEKLV